MRRFFPGQGFQWRPEVQVTDARDGAGPDDSWRFLCAHVPCEPGDWGPVEKGTDHLAIAAFRAYAQEHYLTLIDSFRWGSATTYEATSKADIPREWLGQKIITYTIEARRFVLGARGLLTAGGSVASG